MSKTIGHRLTVKMATTEILDDGERVSIFYAPDTHPDLIETAAMIMRANKRLSFVHLQDLDGGNLTAQRGDQIEEEKISGMTTNIH